MKITAPWTEEIIERLNRWQSCGWVHDYTCVECQASLKATKDGWICRAEGCSYKQDWAHEPPTMEEFKQQDKRLSQAGFKIS